MQPITIQKNAKHGINKQEFLHLLPLNTIPIQAKEEYPLRQSNKSLSEIVQKLYQIHFIHRTFGWRTKVT
jgi:hypothetical protein